MMMSIGDVVFENHSYEVVLDSREDIKGYRVVNKKTGVEEVSELMLPRAISYCTQSDDFLCSVVPGWEKGKVEVVPANALSSN